MITKVCTKCGKKLPISEFNKNVGGKYGVRSICKVCCSKRAKAYNEAHKEQRKAQHKIYNKINKERIRAQRKTYREVHKEQIHAQSKIYSKTHKEQNKVYQETHKEQIAKHRKSYRETHKEQKKAYDEAHKVYIVCLQCNERKRVNPGSKFCSEKCYREWNRGPNSPVYGKQHSPEARKKISEANKGEKHHMFGKHPSEETRKKMSESQTGLRAGEKNPNYAKPPAHIIGEWYTLPDGSNIWTRSSYERRVIDFLIKSRIKWEYEPKAYPVIGHTYRPDFLIDNRVLWEVKGWLWSGAESKLIQFASLYNIPLRMLYKEDIEQLESVQNGVPDVTKVGKDIMTILTDFLSRYPKPSKKQLANITNIPLPNLMETPLICKPI